MQDGKRVPREDIVTDCVFGGLRYLDHLSAACLVRWMLHHIVPKQYAMDRSELWPKEGNREPDAVLSFIAPDSPPITIIVESKWANNKLTSVQLADQWSLFGEGKEGLVYHLLVVEYRKHVELAAYRGASVEDRARRILLTWEDIASRLTHRNKAEGGIQANRLADDIATTLKTFGQRPFMGWSDTAEIAPPLRTLFYADTPWWNFDIPTITQPKSFFQE